MSRKFSDPPNLNFVLSILLLVLVFFVLTLASCTTMSLEEMQQACAEREEMCEEAMQREDRRRQREDREAHRKELEKACRKGGGIMECNVRGGTRRDMTCYCVDEGSYRDRVIW